MKKTGKEDTRESGKLNFRSFQLDALFQDGRYYTAEELMEKLGKISKPTLNRDLERLRDVYNAPLEFSQEHKAYHYTDRLYKFPALFITENEMPAYGLVKKLFAFFHDTPIYKPLLDICENFESPVESEMFGADEIKFKNSELKEKEWFETRIVMAERKVDIIEDEVWPVILSALKDNQVLEFDYVSVRTNKKSFGRTIEPWQLIFDMEQWYLKGMAENPAKPGERALRTFVVPCMENIRNTGRNFVLPDEKVWMHDKYSIGYFGIETMDKTEKCQFIFQGTTLYYSGAEFAQDRTVENTLVMFPTRTARFSSALRATRCPPSSRNSSPTAMTSFPLPPRALYATGRIKYER